MEPAMYRIPSLLLPSLLLLALAASLALSTDPQCQGPAGLVLLLVSGLGASLGCLLCEGSRPNDAPLLMASA